MRLPLVAVLALVACGPPHESNIGEPHPKPPPASNRFSRQEAVARIERVSRTEVVLERAGRPIRVQVPPGTPVYVDGRMGSLAELRPGTRVVLSYDAVEGPPRANWIQVLPVPRAKEP